MNDTLARFLDLGERDRKQGRAVTPKPDTRCTQCGGLFRGTRGLSRHVYQMHKDGAK